MRVIVFFDVCFLYLFCFSQVGILVKIPYKDIHIILFEYMEIHPMTKRSTFLISPGVIMIVRIAILFYFCWILSFDASECEA